MGGEAEKVVQAAEVQARTWRTCDSVQTRFLLRRQRKYIGGESQHLQRFYSQCSGDSGKVQEGCRFFLRKLLSCRNSVVIASLKCCSVFIKVKRRGQVLVCREKTMFQRALICAAIIFDLCLQYVSISSVQSS